MQIMLHYLLLPLQFQFIHYYDICYLLTKFTQISSADLVAYHASSLAHAGATVHFTRLYPGDQDAKYPVGGGEGLVAGACCRLSTSLLHRHVSFPRHFFKCWLQ